MIFFYNQCNQWASGITRGAQIAARIEGAVCNPRYSVNPDQAFIFIKVVPPTHIAGHVKAVYIDAVDNYGVLAWAKFMPDVKMIAVSELSADFMASFMDNEIIVIKEHHCNFEGTTRPVDRPIKTIGYCGNLDNFHFDIDEVSKALTSAGFDIAWCTDVESLSREDICKFYEKLDIQIAYRSIDRKLKVCHQMPCMKNPLKLANAGSFKIPTVCFPEPTYVDEFRDMFISIIDIKGMVDACIRLRDDKHLYEDLSNKVYERAQYYDIERILPLYKELENGQ